MRACRAFHFGYDAFSDADDNRPGGLGHVRRPHHGHVQWQDDGLDDTGDAGRGAQNQ